MALKSTSRAVVSYCAIGSNSARMDTILDNVATYQDQKEQSGKRNIAPMIDVVELYHI
jgi:type II secretory pathway component PulF